MFLRFGRTTGFSRGRIADFAHRRGLAMIHSRQRPPRNSAMRETKVDLTIVAKP